MHSPPYPLESSGSGPVGLWGWGYSKHRGALEQGSVLGPLVVVCRGGTTPCLESTAPVPHASPRFFGDPALLSTPRCREPSLGNVQQTGQTPPTPHPS